MNAIDVAHNIKKLRYLIINFLNLIAFLKRQHFTLILSKVLLNVKCVLFSLPTDMCHETN
jgi:hypothetical protein